MADDVSDEPLQVWVDQDLCTGDGLCVQYAPRSSSSTSTAWRTSRTAPASCSSRPGARTDVPAHLRLDVIDAAKECPGDCIHVRRAPTTASRSPDADADCSVTAELGRQRQSYSGRPTSDAMSPGELLQPGDLPGAAVVQGLDEAQRVLAHQRAVLVAARPSAAVVERAEQQVHVHARPPAASPSGRGAAAGG